MKIVVDNNLKHIAGGYVMYVSQNEINIGLYSDALPFGVITAAAGYGLGVELAAKIVFATLAFPVGFAFGCYVSQYNGLKPGMYDVR